MRFKVEHMHDIWEKLAIGVSMSSIELEKLSSNVVSDVCRMVKPPVAIS